MKMSNYAAFCAVLVSLQYIELVLSSALHSRDRAPADGCCVHCSEEEAYFGYDPTTCHGKVLVVFMPALDAVSMCFVYC